MKITPDVFNKDRIMTANIQWKGKTFNQLNSVVKKNYNNPKSFSLKRDLLFKPPPLKIYRREIASVDISGCNPKTSMRIDQYNMPGANIVTQYTSRGINSTLDFNYENNSCQHPSTTITNSTYCNQFSSEKNALRRVRSSGVLKQNYNSSNSEYLYNRSLTFKQNDSFHIKYGDSLATPGTLAASKNIYVSNSSINSCSKFFIGGTYFAYKWIDNNNYTVNIPQGYYDITDINNLLYSKMITNKHYLIKNATGTNVYFLNFSANVPNKTLTLSVTVANTTLFPIGTTYSYPNTPGWTLPIGPSNYFNPLVILSDKEICNAIGFTSGNYPTNITGYSSNIYYNNTTEALIINSNYKPVYYKPNNPKFSRQGAVTSSDLITRKKYNAITTGANNMRSAFGNQTADALAYGVPTYGYTQKDILGFPLIKTPIISKYDGKLIKCSRLRTIRNLLNG